MTTTARLSAALILALLALVPFAGRAADPYTIYVIASLTGTAAFLGREEANGVAVIQQTVNKSGGIRGRPISFVVQDDGSNAQNAVLLFNQDVAKGATAILGSSLVSQCAAMLPLAANGPLVYCFSPGIHPPSGSYMFSSNISTGDFIVATIRYMRDRGWHRIALVTSTDATGQDAEHGIAAAIAAPDNHGSVTLIDTERFNVGDISVAAQIAKVKASGAQAAILWASGTPFGTLLRESVQDGLNIPLFASAANLNRVQLNAYRSFIPDQLYFAAPAWTAPSAFPDPELQRTIGAYFKAFDAVGIKPNQGQALSWDPTMMLLDALRTKGFEAKPSELREYIAGLKGWVGVNGRYDFGTIPQRGIGIDYLVMTRWDKDKGPIGVSKPGGVLH